MTKYIYSSFKELPANIIAQEKLKQAIATFELTVLAIEHELKIAEQEFITKRDLARQNAKWEYTVINTEKEEGIHYTITGKCLNPLEGDTEFYKDKKYCSFKIVNAVMIRTGGGHILYENGGILTNEEIDQLHNNIVPMRLIEAKAKF